MLDGNLKTEVTALIHNNTPPRLLLQEICDLLQKEVEKYNWVGFYFVDVNSGLELVLGPFAGAATDHTRIVFGQGVCGEAASTLSVRVVDDVGSESNYLSCSPDVRSEFVAPVMWEGKLVGELDLDSNTRNAFEENDTELLKWVAGITAEAVASASGLRYEKQKH